MTPETTDAATTDRRHRGARSAALAVTAAFLICAGSASAAAPNPTANIPVGPLPSACAYAPKGTACMRAMVRALNGAHAQLGLGPYLLPTDFYSLSGSQQLLILCNLDRLAYGLPPVVGLSPVLNAVAASGVTSDSDPDPSAPTGGAFQICPSGAFDCSRERSSQPSYSVLVCPAGRIDCASS